MSTPGLLSAKSFYEQALGRNARDESEETKRAVEPAPALAAGDLVMKARDRFLILAVRGLEADVLQIVMRKGRHRADVPLGVRIGGSAAVVRCVPVERQPLGVFKAAGLAFPAILPAVRLALQREAVTRQGEVQGGHGPSL